MDNERRPTHDDPPQERVMIAVLKVKTFGNHGEGLQGVDWPVTIAKTRFTGELPLGLYVEIEPA